MFITEFVEELSSLEDIFEQIVFTFHKMAVFRQMQFCDVDL